MYTIAETFVGAGGSHLGFKQEGFKSVYVNDFNKDCIDTLCFNNPELKEEGCIVDCSNFIDIDCQQVLAQMNIEKGILDVLFGGIVCKGFSLAGERCPNDERNYFYHKQLELVKHFYPKVSIIENVTGILNAKVLSNSTPKDVAEKVDIIWQNLENYKGTKSKLRKSDQITVDFENIGKNLREEKEIILKYIEDKKYLISVMDDIRNSYAQIGYRVYHKVLNSASFGAATKRERVIIVAIRNDMKGDFHYPKPTHSDPHLLNKYSGYYDANIQYLPSKTVNDALQELIVQEDDLDNIPMKHNPKTVSRFKLIPEGESIANHMDDLPDDLKISKFFSRGNTMRLAGFKPSPTLVPGHSNFPIHPREHRSITVREAALITGFPINYKFFGSHSKRCEHVGNAVPPPLARAIANAVKIFLDSQLN
jgi:DNA (cytosine-5)-methyltransferase 1